MGGVKADVRMATELPGLFVAGEVVGGANGANRLSGNAITEALVFGRRAGESAAVHAAGAAASRPRALAVREALDLICANGGSRRAINTAAMIARLQAVMTGDVGPFRTGAKLQHALGEIAALVQELGEVPPTSDFADTGTPFDLQRLEWFDLRNMLLVARSGVESALARSESRGAHQREDCPTMLPQWQRHQTARWRDGRLQISGAPQVAAASVAS
jgi:succinate dehydrogenase/fumarate reductase flavoprotein subunit